MNIPSKADFELYFNDPLWLVAAGSILAQHRINYTNISRAAQGENIVFLVDHSLVLKIYTPLRAGFGRERAALEFLSGKGGITVPEIVAEGDFEGFSYLIITQIPGVSLSRKEWLAIDRRDQEALVVELGSGLRELHDLNADAFEFDWPAFISVQKALAFSKQKKEGGNPEWIMSLPSVLDEYLPMIPEQSRGVFQHGDVHFGNIKVVAGKRPLRLSGMFDLADSIKGFREYEFVAIGVLMLQGQRDLQRMFFRSYGYQDHELDESLRKRMMALTLLYECSSLKRYAERLGPEAAAYTLSELERAIWNFV